MSALLHDTHTKTQTQGHTHTYTPHDNIYNKYTLIIIYIDITNK